MQPMPWRPASDGLPRITRGSKCVFSQRSAVDLEGDSAVNKASMRSHCYATIRDCHAPDTGSNQVGRGFALVETRLVTCAAVAGFQMEYASGRKAA